MKEEQSKYMTGRTERFNYSVYFLGQNVCFAIIAMFLQQYALDLGVSALIFAGVALAIRGWDAINDPIFGIIMEKVHLKGGKYLPWIRLSTLLIPLTTFLLFAIPSGLPVGVKIVWIVVAYVLWDTAYTIGDVPLYAMSTAMTSIQRERTLLISRGRFFSTLAFLIPALALPMFRVQLGGWGSTVLILSIFSAVTMIPIGFSAKERVHTQMETEESPTLKQMAQYVFKNKYMLLFYIGVLVWFTANISSTMGLVVARHCFGNEAYSSMMAMAFMLPPMLIALILPSVLKHIEKIKLFIISVILTNVMYVVCYFVGYENFTVFIILNFLQGFAYGFVWVLLFTFVGDCCEYGTYKTGIDAKSVGFAAHTFFTKFMQATAMALSSVCLAMIGYVEGEGATQLASLPDRLWALYCLVPVIGAVIALPVFCKYKLHDKDVDIMAQCNSGVITREEAEAKLSQKY